MTLAPLTSLGLVHRNQSTRCDQPTSLCNQAERRTCCLGNQKESGSFASLRIIILLGTENFKHLNASLPQPSLNPMLDSNDALHPAETRAALCFRGQRNLHF